MSRLRSTDDAIEAGFEHLRPDHYGGEIIRVASCRLIRGGQRAVSATEWGRRGYVVLPRQKPHAVLYGEWGDYPLYRQDQVRPKRKVVATPPKLVPILAALWTINGTAKRYRDAARKLYLAGRRSRRSCHALSGCYADRKAELYKLKGQALHYLVADGQLQVVGYHRFPDGNWAEVLQGGDYCFHRPCRDQDATIVQELGEIEARPRIAKEPRLKDALYTVEQYLAGKPWAKVYQWGERYDGELAPYSSADDDDWCDDEEDFW